MAASPLRLLLLPVPLAGCFPLPLLPRLLLPHQLTLSQASRPPLLPIPPLPIPLLPRPSLPSVQVPPMSFLFPGRILPAPPARLTAIGLDTPSSPFPRPLTQLLLTSPSASLTPKLPVPKPSPLLVTAAHFPARPLAHIPSPAAQARLVFAGVTP